MTTWFRHRFRFKVGLFMLPLLLPVGGAAVDSTQRGQPALTAPAWTPQPAAATATPDAPARAFTGTILDRPSLRSDSPPRPAVARPDPPSAGRP